MRPDAYLDPANYDPDEVVQVALAKHTISSTPQPLIELRMRGSKFAEVQFEIKAELRIEGAILDIRKD